MGGIVVQLAGDAGAFLLLSPRHLTDVGAHLLVTALLLRDVAQDRLHCGLLAIAAQGGAGGVHQYRGAVLPG